MVTDELFDRTRRLALELTGIELFERHREILQSRGRRLGIQDVARLDSMLSAAEAGDPVATRQFVGMVITPFTAFFRHPWHFDIAAEKALWAAHRWGRARVWSAGVATGEEPYSLAMALIEVFRRDDPPVSIVATDIDLDALASAEQGTFGIGTLQSLNMERIDRFFTENNAMRWSVSPTVRRLVKFRTLNLAADTWLVDGPFDVVLCRNVLMYLETGRRYLALERMALLLAPDGLLIMDPAEYPGNAGHLFKPEGDGVYSRRKGYRLQREGISMLGIQRMKTL